MQLPHYLGLLHGSLTTLHRAFGEVSARHGDEPDVTHICDHLARRCAAQGEALAPFLERYGDEADDEPERLHSDLFAGTRGGPLGLLRDLHDLYLLACECDICWTMIGQAAQGLRDEEFTAVVARCDDDTKGQLAWLRTRMKQAAPQALLVAR